MWRFKRKSFFVLFRSAFGVRCDEWPENVGNFEKHEIRQQTWSPEFSNPFSDAGASRGKRDATLVKSSWTGRMSILSIESPRYPISTRCETTVDFRNFAFFSLCQCLVEISLAKHRDSSLKGRRNSLFQLCRSRASERRLSPHFSVNYTLPVEAPHLTLAGKLFSRHAQVRVNSRPPLLLFSIRQLRRDNNVERSK